MDVPFEEPFALAKLLGMGGFARTYLARVLDLELAAEYGTEEVVLKIPLDRAKQKVLRREIELNAFHVGLKEAQAPNLVRYLGFEAYKGQIVMVMEYAPQGSLRSMLGPLNKQKALPVKQSVSIAQGVLQGLAFIHKRQILHRDIKPENILMHGTTPKVGDLGISRILEQDQLASTRIGTEFYVAPEVIGSGGASFPSDIWSVGVTLYEMLTGKLPFGDSTTPRGQLMDRIRHEPPSPLDELAPEVPRALSDIVMKALEKDPASRFESADAMDHALARFLKRPDPLVEQELSAIRELMLQPEQTARVARRLQRLTGSYPQDAQVRRCQGEFYNRCQRYGEAIESFQQGIKLDAEEPLLYWGLAIASQKVGKVEEAIQHLEKAIQLGLDQSLQRHARKLPELWRNSSC